MEHGTDVAGWKNHSNTFEMNGITCKEEDRSFLSKGVEMISDKLKILKLSSLEASAKLFSVFVSNHTRLPFLAKIDLSHTTILFRSRFCFGNVTI